MLPLIRIVGRSGSGKTTLLTKVIPLLRRRGLRVAVLKHTHHTAVDVKGKDSFRFAEAGAEAVTLVSPAGMATFERPERELPLDALTRRFEGRVDLVLAEGFSGVATPHLLVLAANEVSSSRKEPGELLARVAPVAGPEALCRDYPEAVAELIAEWLSRQLPAQGLVSTTPSACRVTSTQPKASSITSP